MNTEKENAIKQFQEQLILQGIWRCCLNCEHFIGNKCLLADTIPPPQIIIFGCESHIENIPF